MKGKSTSKMKINVSKIKMKGIFKRITLAILPILVLIAFTSCSLENQFSPEGVIEYLNSKYDTEFTYLETVGDGELTYRKNVSAYVTHLDHEDRQVFVVAELTQDGVKYSDSYIALKYEEDTRKYLNDMVGKVFKDYKLIYTPVSGQTFSDEFNNDTSFDEYRINPRNLLRFDIILPDNYNWDYKNASVSHIETKIINSGTHCTVNVYRAKTKEIYDSINSYSDYYDKTKAFDEKHYFEANKSGKQETVTEPSTSQTTVQTTEQITGTSTEQSAQ